MVKLKQLSINKEKKSSQSNTSWFTPNLTSCITDHKSQNFKTSKREHKLAKRGNSL